MFRKRLLGTALTAALAVTATVTVLAPAPAALAAAQPTTLEHAGAAAELRGLRSRVIAFYEWRGDLLELTVLMSGGIAGGEILKMHVRLRDGQRHAVRLAGGNAGEAVEIFTFQRIGDVVTLAVETGASAVAHLGN